MAIVELRHVGKRYPGSTSLAVEDFNLVTQDGMFVQMGNNLHYVKIQPQ